MEKKVCQGDEPVYTKQRRRERMQKRKQRYKFRKEGKKRGKGRGKVCKREKQKRPKRRE